MPDSHQTDATERGAAHTGEVSPASPGSHLARLSQAAATGDERAFGQLVAATSDTVYRVALRMMDSDAEAQDAVQDTYLRVWQNLGRVRDHTAILAWICRICRNLCTDRLRSQKRRPTEVWDGATASRMAAFLDRAGVESVTPEQQLADAQAGAALLALVNQLKEKHRIVLLLRVVEGMSCDEIATVLGCPVGTVESRLHRGRLSLAGKLDKMIRRQTRSSHVV